MDERGFNYYISGLDILAKYMQHIPEQYPIIVFIEKEAKEEIFDNLILEGIDVLEPLQIKKMYENAIFSGNKRMQVVLYATENFTCSEDGLATVEKAFVDLFFAVSRNNYSLSLQYKGKLTTKSENHSGEGIFFTSKVLNEFAIWSDNAIYSQGCYDKQRFTESHLISYYNKLHHIGTMVVMKLENQTTRTVKEVFDMFAPIEEGFIKTRIPLAEVCPFAEPVARSQARRILYRLEQFKQIEFDFDGVEFMGQGFADEVFRVFHNKYPEIELIPVNANRTVLGMIKHVQRNC